MILVFATVKGITRWSNYGSQVAATLGTGYHPVEKVYVFPYQTLVKIEDYEQLFNATHFEFFVDLYDTGKQHIEKEALYGVSCDVVIRHPFY